MEAPKVLIGTRAYPAQGEARRRQANAQESLRRLRGVRLANIQFASREEWIEVEGFQNQALLKLDSRSVTGASGILKPVAGEMFDCLAEVARSERCEWFGFANADIQLADSVVERVQSSSIDAWIFAREDFDRATPDQFQMNLIGTDVFFVRTSAWSKIRRNFQNYIIGELAWDNVYAAQLLMLLNGRLCTEPSGVRHENHPTAWGTGVFAAFNGWLSVWDSDCFSRWCEYAWYLKHSGNEASPASRLEMEQRIFGRPLRLDQKVRSVLRRLWYGPRHPRWLRSVVQRASS